MTALSAAARTPRLGKIARSLALGGLLIAAVGCSNSIYQHRETKIGAPDNMPISRVTAAIQSAAQATEWSTTMVQPGMIQATREWGGDKHNIVVDITYDTKTYKITYKSSKNLGYNGRRIHRAYREQVVALDTAIRARTWNMKASAQ